MTSPEFFQTSEVFHSHDESNINQDAAATAAARRDEVNYTARHDQILSNLDLDHLPPGTPPVTENLLRLAQTEIFKQVSTQLKERVGGPINATLLGVAFPEAVPWVLSFIQHQMGSPVGTLTVVDIDPQVIAQVEALGLSQVTTAVEDARHTHLADQSQHLVIRDHLGNCCPPAFDRAIDRQAHRILMSSGFALVNITTSELLTQSAGREVIRHSELVDQLGLDQVNSLQQHIYDLEALSRITATPVEHLRGELLEIEHRGSFVVFGDTGVGQGEWFRTIESHQHMWQQHGFSIVGHSQRSGTDSHIPPLECLRHIIVLKKE